MNFSKEELALYEHISKLNNFVRDILGGTPTPQQQQVIDAIDRGKLAIAIKSGHGTGKTTLLCWVILWAGLTKYDCRIPCTAPSAPQLQSVLLPELKKWRDKLPDFFKKEVEVQTETVRFANGNFAVIRTAKKDQPEALAGFHASNLIYVVDEGSGVPDSIYEVIEGALTGVGNMVIVASNPTRPDGYFYNIFTKFKRWTLFTFNAEESPNVTKEFIEKAREDYGVDSDFYRVRVLGEFPRTSSDAILSVEEIEAAMEREEALSVGSEIWGVDIAAMGDDRSVICKRKNYKVVEFVVSRNPDLMETAYWIANQYRIAEKKPNIIIIEINGMGLGVYHRCQELGLPVYGADVSRASAMENLFNKRTEMYFRLKDALKYMSLPKDDELAGELAAIRYRITEKGKIALEAKKETKSRLGRSPDKGDSLALTFYETFYFETEEDDEIGRGDYLDEGAITRFGDVVW